MNDCNALNPCFYYLVNIFSCEIKDNLRHDNLIVNLNSQQFNINDKSYIFNLPEKPMHQLHKQI